jgi:uncharacterized protein YggE
MAMKRLALLAAMCLIGGGCVTFEPSFTFKVEGEGRVAYAPDVANVYLRVSARERTIDESRKVHDATVEKMQSYLHANGYAEEDLRLESFGDRFVAGGRTLRSGSGSGGMEAKTVEIPPSYRVKSHYILRTSRIGELSKLLGDMRGIGVVPGHVLLVSSNMRELTEQARVLALADAREKAAVTASELGMRIGHPVGVGPKEEPPVRVARKDRIDWGGGDDDDDDSWSEKDEEMMYYLLKGRLTRFVVEASVEVEYSCHP